ncbi:MAG: O-methyltransferase [Flavobacteriaceae bacterium]|nr:O-methyltransferase [Flavobacteriaceae bacterium]
MGNRDFQDEKLDSYLESVCEKEPALLKELRLKTIENFEAHHMVSGHVQGRFLSLISKILQPRHILEIGTFTGYASLCLAEGLSADGKLTTLEIDEKMAEFYSDYFQKSKFNHQIFPVVEDAISYLQRTDETYDLVFLDANKKKYMTYFDLLVPKMTTGGMILADNTLWKGEVLENRNQQSSLGQAISDFNNHVAKDERVEVVLLPLRDGISLIRKK